ncbi:hypothetical protein ACE1AT_29380 [Pelatocladus sp. BLCC-F211]|uniref:hypothetical protein n=1 Tax=Pelatocladus sp. BLCC-F211 TaxID=3342752 RepID=UPI0035BABB85
MISTHKFSHNRHLQRCLGILVTLLTLSQSQAWAEPSVVLPEPTQIYELATPQQLTIPPQQLGEVLPASESETVSNEQDLLAPPPINTVVTREFPGMWQMRVPIDEVDSLYATYELKAVNGQSDGFSSSDRTNQNMRTHVEALPIVEVSRDETTNTAVVEGGVRLQFDLSTAAVAGEYGGVLTVTVNRQEK